MLDAGAVSAPDGSGFSEESLIQEAFKAWDTPDEPTSGTEPPENTPPEASGAEPVATDPPSPDVLTDRGDGRDSKGRFAPKGEKQETAGTGEAEAPDATPSPTQATKAEAAPETPPGSNEPPKAEDAVTAEPFSVRYNGTDYAIPGAVRTDTHILIPRDQEDLIGRYIGRGLRFDTERETFKQERARLAVEREMFTAETGPVMEEVKRLFEIAALPDEEEFAKQFSAYAWQLRTELPLLRERMELSKKRQELAIRERLSQPDPEVQVQQLATSTIETAENHLTRWKSDPQTKAMTEDDWQWVRGKVTKDPANFLSRAGERLTPEEQQAGIQPGEVYFREDRLVELVNDRMEQRRAITEAIEAQKKAVALAKENATRRAAPTVPPPPTSGGADTAPVSVENGGPEQFKNLEELKRALNVAW